MNASTRIVPGLAAGRPERSFADMPTTDFIRSRARAVAVDVRPSFHDDRSHRLVVMRGMRVASCVFSFGPSGLTRAGLSAKASIPATPFPPTWHPQFAAMPELQELSR
jgi:hypothetical protein